LYFTPLSTVKCSVRDEYYGKVVPMHYGTVLPIMTGTPDKFARALDAKGLGDKFMPVTVGKPPAENIWLRL